MRSFLCIALCAPLTVAAAESATPLDPLVVTATGTEQHQSQTLAATLVLNREEIERAQADDLSDLLRFYAGIEVDRAGGPGQLAQVRVRGGETDHVLLLIDGVKVNPASNGPTLQSIAPETIERIEIVKGPRATLYGSEGISATINVITRGSGARTGAQLRLGSDDTREAGAWVARHTGDAGFSLSAQRTQSDGFPTCADSDLDRASRQTTLSANGHVRSRGGLEFSARALDAQGSAQYLNFGCPGGFLPSEQDFHTQVLATALEAQPSARWQTTLTLSRTLDDLQQQETPDYARTRRPRLDWNNVLELGAQRLSLGLEYEHERAEALFTGFGAPPIEERRDIVALRAQDEIHAGRHHALLGVRALHDSGFGDHLIWNAEYGIDAWTGGRLVATAGSGFRAPTFLERSPGFFGNPDLGPEESLSFEAGVTQRIGTTQHLDLRWFRTDTEDLITGFPPVNVAEARSEGLDLSWRLALSGWSLTATGIVQDPVDRSSGAQLARRAKRSAALKVDRALGRHSVGLDLLGSSERRDTAFDPVTFAATPVTLPGYALLNLHATVVLDTHTRLLFSGVNVLDKEYQTAFGYRQAGAGAYVSLRYEL